MQQSATYREQSREFLDKAYAELEQDLGQACEKGWGAAAEIVKAVAEERGLYHRSHNALHRIINGLTNETGDPELRRLFAVANYLHVNFYENWYDRQWVESNLQDVEQLVTKVEALLSSSS